MNKPKFESNEVLAERFMDEDIEIPNLFSSLDELLVFISQFDTTGCYFRGQEGLWPIVSTIFRHYGSEKFNTAMTTSAAAVKFIKDNPYIRTAIQDSTNHALAIAQHYGCPTDLVDITTDVNVAGYFASAENQNHEQNPVGCIWVFTPRDMDAIQEYISEHHAELFQNASEEILTSLQENNWSLLYEIRIPELSRLNAQCGAFLWDVGGSLDQLLEWRIPVGIRLEFKHTDNERDSFRELEERLFPYPNQLESEIMRIFKERSREKGLPTYGGLITKVINEQEGVTTNGLPNELVEAFGTEPVMIPFPDLFRPKFTPYPWRKHKLTDTFFKVKRMNMEKCLHCYLQDDVEAMQQVVDHILESYRNECLTDYYIAVFAANRTGILSVPDAEPIIDMVINLSNYGYTNVEISRVLREYFRLEFFKGREEFLPATDEERVLSIISGEVERVLKEYYGCNVTKLFLADEQEQVSFWLPETYNFLEQRYLEAFKRFDKSVRTRIELLEDTFAALPDNAQIFLYQHRPEYLMPYDNMRELFIRFYLPQLYAFRVGTERMMLPDYLTSISLPYFGRVLYISKGQS